MPSPFPILYEDDALIAFDKPPDLLTAPDRWDRDGRNLMQLVHESFGPEIVNAHRVDRAASGVVLCARSPYMLEAMLQQFRDQLVRRRDLAITRGAPLEAESRVDQPIATDPAHVGRMKTSHRYGRAADTLVRVLTRWRGYTLVEALTETDRIHQIRLHLESLGCPVLADSFYGNGLPLMLSDLKSGYRRKPEEEERPILGRLALHTESLTFGHPLTKKHIVIKSPLPKDFQVAIRYLDLFATV